MASIGMSPLRRLYCALLYLLVQVLLASSLACVEVVVSCAISSSLSVGGLSFTQASTKVATWSSLELHSATKVMTDSKRM
eukprot:6474874-Amphidinium_carterae.2